MVRTNNGGCLNAAFIWGRSPCSRCLLGWLACAVPAQSWAAAAEAALVCRYWLQSSDLLRVTLSCARPVPVCSHPTAVASKRPPSLVAHCPALSARPPTGCHPEHSARPLTAHPGFVLGRD
eukprot:355627-Chlamydomonas_euryale.AAC.12